MISETNEMIEQFVLGKLEGKALKEFKTEIKKSPQLAIEVEFFKEMINSINENDIMDLRLNIQSICNENVNQTYDQVNFDLAQNLTINQSKEFSNDVSISENSLQQIHIENHKKSLTERIHQVNMITDSDQDKLLSKSINDFSFWEEIKEAVLEKEVIDLRNNLKEITSQGHVHLSDFEIDEYLSRELPTEKISEIDKMVANNKKLFGHIKLHQEINFAINENDIIHLRNSLSSIVGSEQQIDPMEIKRIDNYLLNYLDETEKANLELELIENPQFEIEFQLNNEINSAIIESEVMKIRASLADIIEENTKSSKVRKFIPENLKGKPMRFIGAAASVAAVVSAGFLSLNHENMNAEKLFRQAYQPYQATGLFRSVTVTNPAINGVDLYNAHRFDEALSQFAIVLKDNNEHPMSNFFSGLCFMEKNQYENAIVAFNNVIDEKDNLFIEQAQWYMALSMLGSNNEKDAYELLNRIVLYNGYYKRNAKELLKKLK